MTLDLAQVGLHRVTLHVILLRDRQAHFPEIQIGMKNQPSSLQSAVKMHLVTHPPRIPGRLSTFAPNPGGKHPSISRAAILIPPVCRRMPGAKNNAGFGRVNPQRMVRPPSWPGAGSILLMVTLCGRRRRRSQTNGLATRNATGTALRRSHIVHGSGLLGLGMIQVCVRQCGGHFFRASSRSGSSVGTS